MPVAPGPLDSDVGRALRRLQRPPVIMKGTLLNCRSSSDRDQRQARARRHGLASDSQASAGRRRGWGQSLDLEIALPVTPSPPAIVGPGLLRDRDPTVGDSDILG